MMSESDNRTPASGKKHERTWNRLIILMLVLAIAVPWVGCGVLFASVKNVNRTLAELSERLDRLTDIQGEYASATKQQETPKRQETPEWQETPEPQEIPESQESSEPAEGTVSDEKEEPEAEETFPEEESGRRKVYLTFDDGPSVHTEEILDILEQYDVKATFFVVGKEDEASKEALRDIVDRGHTLGMHSYSHKYRELYESLDSFEEDFLKLRSYLSEVTGQVSMFYRFPGGSSNTVSDIDMREFAEYLESEGVTFFDWNISSGDGGSAVLPVETLVENCTQSVGQWNSSVILMHDSAEKSTTVEALPTIIETIQAMEDTDILPITEDTVPIQHIHITPK